MMSMGLMTKMIPILMIVKAVKVLVMMLLSEAILTLMKNDDVQDPGSVENVDVCGGDVDDGDVDKGVVVFDDETEDAVDDETEGADVDDATDDGG